MPYAPKKHTPTRTKRTRKRYDSATDAQRPSAAKRGYDGTWRKLRKAKLAQTPLCEHCEQRGTLTPAIEVDHIKPISEGGERLDMNNLQSLCTPCHSRKTRRENR